MAHSGSPAYHRRACAAIGRSAGRLARASRGRAAIRAACSAICDALHELSGVLPSSESPSYPSGRLRHTRPVTLPGSPRLGSRRRLHLFRSRRKWRQLPLLAALPHQCAPPSLPATGAIRRKSAPPVVVVLFFRCFQVRPRDRPAAAAAAAAAAAIARVYGWIHAPVASLPCAVLSTCPLS